MMIRKTGTVAALATLLSLAGVAGAQEETEPSPPPETTEPSPPPKEGETVETEEVPPGTEVEVETRVRRKPAPTPPPPPAPPMAEEPPPPPMAEEPPPPPAAAQTPPPAPIREALIVYDGDDEGRPELASRIGIGLTAGGGVNDFTDDDVEALTQIGGAWDVRLTIGTRSIIAGEIGYVGSARDIDALGLDSGALLTSHGGEAAARLNFLSGMVQPYIFGGVGFTHYRLANSDFNTSAVDDDDNLAHFPVGGGLGFRYSGFMMDGRGTFRPVASEDLFGEEGSMHTWEAKLSGGFEF